MKRFSMFILITVIMAATSSMITKANDVSSKKELVKRVLKIAVISGKIPDYKLIKNKNNIVISSKNINARLLPDLSGVSFTLLKPGEIQKRADSNGDFLYLEFKKIYIDNNTAIFSLNNKWAVQDGSKAVYTSGGGMTITFHKSSGKWVEDEKRQMWIS